MSGAGPAQPSHVTGTVRLLFRVFRLMCVELYKWLDGAVDFVVDTKGDISRRRRESCFLVLVLIG